MTTQEASKILKILLRYLKGEIEPPKQEAIEEARVFEQQGYECLEMAIKALETVSCIKEKCAYCPHCDNCDVDDETLEIKALEQQPCEDCISRQSVKHKLQEHHDLFINAYGGRVGFKSMADAKEKARVDEINNCIAIIVNEPFVTPKEKTGKWKVQHTNLSHLPSDTIVICLECGHTKSRIDGEILNFCPKCGARMVIE